ncbi:helix-turn-helix transcriptional regulator [Dysgonomonas sp. HGC4]|nr:S24 family peptidase [Dysgonomonas sp. HGC4]
MSEDNTARFIAYYPEVSIEWLITGKGDMLKNEPKEYTQKEEIINTLAESESNIKKYNFKSDYFNINNQLIPLYEIEAVAGLNTLFSNQIDQSPIDYISVPNAPKCDGALFVRGDSMYPIMKSGDIVCYKQIKDTQNNIRFGEIYLLYIDDGDDEYLTIKYVQLSDRGKDYVKLVSQNQYHAPKDEHISHIKGLAIIKLSIRYNTIS